MRDLSGPLRLLVFGWAASAAAVHLYFGGFGFPEPIGMRGFHLTVFVPLCFLLWPALSTSRRDRPTLLDWAWAVVAAAPHAWVMWNWDVVSDRMEYVDPFGPLYMVLGIIAIVTLLEATRRAVEPGLAWMIIICLGYMLAGPYLPGVLNTRVFTWSEIVESAWLVPTAGGVYGPLTGIVATTIAVFILFGAFLQASGTGRLFTNLGAAAAGRFSGGPAKVAVVTSGLFGTMSGSSVSNVITTGAMTIPLMIRIGYKPAVAGGIEAAASVGGALMPPVMGAAAFVMAEITNIPYSQIVVAAAIGAALYYYGILAAVHFEAKKAGMRPMTAAEIPPWREVLADAHLVIPIGVLVWLMSERWSGNFAAFWACIAMVGVAFLRRRSRMGPRQIFAAFVNAGLVMAPLAVTIAGAGIVVSCLTATGMVVAFGGIIKGLAGGSLPLLLVLLAFTVLVLGMGIPTTPSYIIAAAIGVPQMIEMGVPMLAAHLFIFYFAVLADASPPVAAAAFAASAIAKSGPTITSVHATRFGIAGFTVGFAFIYDPGIMFQGNAWTIFAATTTQVAALTMVTAAIAGFLMRPMGPVLRLVLGLGGFVAVFAHTLPDELRLAVSVGGLGAALLLQFFAVRKGAPA